MRSLISLTGAKTHECGLMKKVKGGWEKPLIYEWLPEDPLAFQPSHLQYWSQQQAYNTHFTVLLQSLSETRYERGKFSAYIVESNQTPVIIVTKAMTHTRKLNWSLLFSFIHMLPKSKLINELLYYYLILKF